MNIILVALGGFFGSILRLYLSQITEKRLIGTWIANISGSLLLAFIFYLQVNGQITTTTWALLGVGFSGAYTTFSTFGNETLQLFFDKKYKTASLYIVSTLSVSIILVSIVLYI
ncbi:CrcB family protein [Oceanobacillus sp. Castelsardo]|uniref:fluoride efflux transporter FluC n=1 Tax=Oceanobacillus sp. Castelsardo TaxID=1851204 RepID=UPI0008392CC9|nr:CrcB family protein [Oceanobacillus sp. Castelsardo]